MRIAGIMSGTSGDGLDCAICTFSPENESLIYNIEKAKTFHFPKALASQLRNAHHLDGYSLTLLHKDFGKFIAQCVNELGQGIDLISSHGHTVFHSPEKMMTLQIGCGATISALTKTPVVCDFRTTDVGYGGQGAPLVPIGDEFLFSQYDACLNLGGICNISIREKDKRRAWDVTFCNLVLNYLAAIEGKPYDENGKLAHEGKIIPELLQQLNNLDFYSLSPPKSLGREWIEEFVLPILNNYKNPTSDLLRTCCRHIAKQIGHEVGEKVHTMLVTGGGAFNQTLVDEIKDACNCQVIIPESDLICFKESIVFGLLGYLRWHEQNNVWSMVTGSSKDTSSGAIYLP